MLVLNKQQTMILLLDDLLKNNNQETAFRKNSPSYFKFGFL